MKPLRLAAWTVWFTLSWIALAHADPISGIVAAIGTFLASGTALANLAWSAILTVAKIGLPLLQKAKQGDQQAGISSDIKFGGDNPLSFIIGTFATAGQLEYGNTWGKAGKTPNAYITDVISAGDLPAGISGLWADDKRVTLPDMSGTAPTDQGWPVEDFHGGGGNDFLWVKYLDGTQTATDPLLLSKFGADPDRPILSDMIWRGVPLLIVTARFKQALWNGIPQYLIETPGIPLYDPRKDSSVGGSGSHRWNDWSTWEPSDNPIVQIYNIHRGIHYEGEWVWGGSCEAWQLPLSNWFAAMNACDTLVDLADGGQEKQFRSGLEITVDQEPADVIENLLKGCNGRSAEVGGVYKVHVGAPGAAVYSFTDETIVVTEGQSLDPFPGLEQTFNGAQASYPEPSEKWAAKDAPAYLRSDLEVLDDNRQLVTGLQYPSVPYAVQVQRLLKAAVEDARRFKVHQLVLPPEAWLLEPNDVVAWTSARNGYSEKKFIITEIQGDSNFLQYVTLKEVDPSDYSWDAGVDELPYSVGPVGDIIPPAQDFAGWAVEPYTFTDASGNGRRPGIVVKADGDLDDVEFVRVQVRKAGTTSVLYDQVKPYGDPLTNPDPILIPIEFSGILPDTGYEARGLLEPISDRETEWSDWLSVTTPDVRFTGDDIADGAISITKFADGITPVELGEGEPSDTDPDNFDGRTYTDTETGILWTFKDGHWSHISADVLDGSITSAKLADAAVTANKLMDAAVTALKLADAAVTSNKIATGAVLSAKLADNAVTVSKVADLAISAAKLANGAVTTLKLADLAVDASKLAAGAVTTAKFAAGLTPVEIVAALPATGNFEGRQVYLTTDDKVYRYTGTAWTAAVAAANVTGQLTDAQIAAIAAAKVTGQITGTQITDGAISTPKLAAGSVTSATIAAGTILAEDIAAGAITTAKLAAGAVTANELAANAVTADKIFANAVTTGKLAAGAVTADQVAASAITTAKLAANAITADKIAANAVTARNLVITDGNNLVPDNQMVDQASWTPLAGGWNYAPSASDFTNGRGWTYAYVAGGTGYSPGLQSLPFPVVAGQNYLATVQSYGLGNYGLYARLQFFDNAGASLGFSSIVQSTFSAGGVRTHTATITALSGAKTAVLQYCINRDLTDNLVQVGGPVFKQKDAASLIVSGGILADMLAAGSVTTAKLAAGAVTANEIAAGAITTAKLGAGVVTANELAAGAVTAAKIAAASVSGDKMVANTITARELVLTDFSNVVPDADNMTAGWTLGASVTNPATAGSPWRSAKGVAYAIPSGATDFFLLANSPRFAVQAAQVYQGYGQCWVNTGSHQHWMRVDWLDGSGAALTGGEGAAYTTFVPSAVRTGFQDLNGEVTVPAAARFGIVKCYVQLSTFTAGAITYAAGLMLRKKGDANLLVDGAVTAAAIAANAVTAGKIAANAVTAGTIAAGAVSASQIAAGAVTSDKIAAGSITADKITVGKLDAGQVLQDGTLITDLIAFNAITDSTSGAVSNVTVSDGSTIDALVLDIPERGQDTPVDISAILASSMQTASGTTARIILTVVRRESGVDTAIPGISLTLNSGGGTTTVTASDTFRIFDPDAPTTAFQYVVRAQSIRIGGLGAILSKVTTANLACVWWNR